ncbi:DUF3313 domain-containing protein [Pantoea agglomerans]
MVSSQSLSLKMGVIACLMLLAGCSSKVAETHQYSGFMKDYSNLTPVETTSGYEVLRWTAPDFRISQYKDIYMTPVIYYPPPVPNSRVSTATLEQIRMQIEQKLKTAVNTVRPLSNEPHAGGLIFSVAISAVSSENKDIRVYELLPVTAVIAGTMTIAGQRSHNTFFLIEGVLTDVSTNKPVLKVVRKAYGGAVSNSSAPITAADLRKAIDDMAKNVVDFPKQ